MLQAGVRRLSRGVAASTSLASGAAAAISYRPLSFCPHSSRRCQRSVSRFAPLPGALYLFSAAFHSEAYFNSAQSGSFPTKEQAESLQSERYLPPLLDIDLIAQDDAQHALFGAIQQLDADLSWQLYQQLGAARFRIPRSAIDLLITLQCRKPVRSTSDRLVDRRDALRRVCDRVLQLCQDRVRTHIGSSTERSSLAAQDNLSVLSAPVSLRLLYLLVVEEEQLAASKSPRRTPRRAHLSNILKALSANIDAHQDFAEQHFDIQLRGRLAATLSRLGSAVTALHQLQQLVRQARQAAEEPFIDPRPFDQLLSALARERLNPRQLPKYLPSPVDPKAHTVDQDDPILQALQLTLLSRVPVSKANVHKCLQALDSATLWWLLPFELDGDDPSQRRSTQLMDNRVAFKFRWHPWQTGPDGLVISQDLLNSFAQRVSLVLAQRGILQPALHIFECLQSSESASAMDSYASDEAPDNDLFTVVLEKLAERMESNNAADARKSLDVHRGLSSDLHLAFQVYSIARSVGVDLDSRVNEAILKALSACLPTAIVDLGPARSRFSKVKAHIAQRNEDRGSRQALQVYLRRFSVMILGEDPDLSKGSLSFPAQATLLGLHMRTRDYSFSRRLYQLVRLCGPDRDLWSTDPAAGSLRHCAIHPLAAPDDNAFLWLFAESLRSSARIDFAIRLYLDWHGSGNGLPSGLTAVFIQALLRAGLTTVVQRVLRELQQERVLLPARLARSLVISFAEAGFPDLALELAWTVSQAAASSTSLHKPDPEVSKGSFKRDSRLLSPSLKLMSLAMDRASKISDPQDVERHRKVLRLFDEFRLGLAHHLFGMFNRAGCDSELQEQVPDPLTLQDVRMAYNATMRARMANVMRGVDIESTPAEEQPGALQPDIELVHGDVEALFAEMENLGVEANSDAWTLRLTSCLQASLKASTEAQQEYHLQKSLDLYKHASEQVFRSDGLVQEPEQTSSSSSTNLHPVAVHPSVVSVLINICCRCNRLPAGLGVYAIHKGQGGFNVHVEEARLMLLAALAEPGVWQRELEQLVQGRNAATFKPDERFLKRLRTLSSCQEHVPAPAMGRR